MMSPGKFLTFHLGNETFGLPILKVQEIIGLMPITLVPKSSDFVRGVINLRGKVIPVLGLRKKFDMLEIEDTDRTCIIVVQVDRLSGKVIMGLLVDDVSEVLNIGIEQIEEPPDFGMSINSEFISGMGKLSQKLVMLLEVDKVLAANEIEAIKAVK